MRKIEIDVQKQVQLRPAIEFARRNKMSAIVVAPDLVVTAAIDRAMARAADLKIITTVD